MPISPSASLFEEAAAGHAEEVSRFLDAVAAVPADRWLVPPRQGKWSAAEVAQHMVLVYDYLTGEQEGHQVIPLRVPRWRAWLLRRTVLPRLLAGRPLPPGVRSPREARPSGELPDQVTAARRIEAGTAAWVAAVRRNLGRPDAGAGHPFFGRLPLTTMMRFATVHLSHHGRQLERAGRGLTMHGD